MKSISILILVLASSVAFAQHPLYKKGPKAKNYMVTKTEKLQPTQVSLYAQPSDKYEAGANAKNRTLNKENDEKVSGYVQTGIKRGTGANAKNRYVRDENQDADDVKSSLGEEQEDHSNSQLLQRR